MKIACVTGLLLVSMMLTLTHGALVVSVSNGNWTTASVWSPNPPVDGDDVQIKTSVQFDATGTVSVSTLTIDVGKTFSSGANTQLTVNFLNCSGTVSGAGLIRVHDLTLSSTASFRMTTASAVLEVSGDIANENNRNLEAPIIRLVGRSTMQVSGSVQTGSSATLEIPADVYLKAGASGIRLAGTLSLGGSKMQVEGGLTLAGVGIINGGSISTVGASAGNIVVSPTSTLTISNGRLSLTAGGSSVIQISTSKTLMVAEGQTLTCNNVVVDGELSGTNAVVRVQSIQVNSAGAVQLSGGASLLEISRSYSNINDVDLEADIIRFTGAQIVASGLVQSNRAYILTIASTLSLLPGTAAIKLGGIINLNNNDLLIRSGNVSLVGTSLQQGSLIGSADDSYVLINPSRTSFAVGGDSVEFLSGKNAFVTVAASKRLDVSGTAQVRINNLQLEGSLIGTTSARITNLQMLSSTSTITLTGGSSLLIISGYISNDFGATLSADTIRLVTPESPGARSVTGLLQSSKTAALQIVGDQILAPGAAGFSLGGLLDLGTYSLRVAGSNDVLLAGSGIVATGGRLVADSANIAVVGASASSTYLVPSGSVTLATTSAAAYVNVSSGRTLSVSSGAFLSVASLLIVDAGAVAGAGSIKLQHVDMRTGGGSPTSSGTIKMDTVQGVVEVTGNINNPNNASFYAASIRLSTAFVRTIVGVVQTSTSGSVVLLSATSLSSTSSASFGGNLNLNGQSLTLESSLVITASVISGPGSIRYGEGCACNLLSLTLSPAGTVTISGVVIFQNLAVTLGAGKALDINRANSTCRVGGAKSNFLINGRVSGSGKLYVYAATIGSSGRISMTVPASLVEYNVPIVNPTVYPVAAGTVQQASSSAIGTCENNECATAALADLRRQVQLLSGQLSGACPNGAARRWNADFSVFGCF